MVNWREGASRQDVAADAREGNHERQTNDQDDEYLQQEASDPVRHLQRRGEDLGCFSLVYDDTDPHLR